ncbi:hypothetical protein [Sphingobium phenoxybenzoativorans]|uniref:hypothetical protein n=1 Tax=Sphingobium phenoxybenzoativorans TaxID=1592790 RepID=UPI0008729C6F|nr:hypothetical protein [Sphingobium phenoxybenzoativorans]
MMATQLHAKSLPAVVQILGRFDRRALASFITVAIDLLDALDGDPDLEDTDIEDGDPLDLGEAQADTEILVAPPRYGVDQTLGPVNEVEAIRAHQLAMYRQGGAG